MQRRIERFRPEPWIVTGLDAARALAAIYVVIHHVSGAMGVSGALGAVLRFGQEAVVVFFVMSGAVIFMNEYNRSGDLRGYGIRRLRRIYPPLVIAMLISAAIAMDNGTLAKDLKVWELIGNLFALQDIKALKPGVWVDPFLGNSPLWSLSYEIVFYILFPPAVWLWKRSEVVASHLIGAGACLAYASYVLWPNHLSLVLAYFQVWWLGAMAAWAAMQGRKTLLSLPIETFWTVALCGVSAVSVYAVGYKGLGFYPFLQLRHFFIAFMIVLVIFGPVGVCLAKSSKFGGKVWAFLASISYGLYVFHYPILVQWKRVDGMVAMGGGAALLVTAAWLFDRQMNVWLPRGGRNRTSNHADIDRLGGGENETGSVASEAVNSR